MGIININTNESVKFSCALLAFSLATLLFSQWHLTGIKRAGQENLEIWSLVEAMPTSSTIEIAYLSDTELLTLINKTSSDNNIIINRITNKDRGANLYIENHEWDATLRWLDNFKSAHSAIQIDRLHSSPASGQRDGRANVMVEITARDKP